MWYIKKFVSHKSRSLYIFIRNLWPNLKSKSTYILINMYTVYIIDIYIKNVERLNLKIPFTLSILFMILKTLSFWVVLFTEKQMQPPLIPSGLTAMRELGAIISIVNTKNYHLSRKIAIYIMNVTTEFHCCSAVSRSYGGKTREIIIIFTEIKTRLT